MRMLIPFLIEDTRLVEEINADLAGGMDNLLVAHNDTYMGNLTFLVAEESQISDAGFLEEIHQLATLDLLRGIAGEEQAAHSGTDLYKA